MMLIKKPYKIYLIGPMGSGKSSVGKKLAHDLQINFYDADVELEKNTGVKINDIFEKEGETGFRLRETRTLEHLITKDDCVIAFGGGVITQAINRELLRQYGFVIYLQVNIEEQLKRLHYSKNRPLLQTPDREAKLTHLFNERKNFYESSAHLIIETSQKPIAIIVEEIKEELTIDN